MLKAVYAVLVLCLTLVVGSNVPTDKGEDWQTEDVAPGDFPYFVAVVNKANGEMVSGGVLLQAQVVLTLGSSYSYLSPSEISVVLGANNRSMYGVAGKEEVNVTEILFHPDMTSEDPKMADVALLKLEKPAELCPNVQAIGLDMIKGRKNKMAQRKKPRTKCVSYGFLRRSYGENTIQQLQKIGTAVQRPETCQAFSNFNSFPWDRSVWSCSVDDAFSNKCPCNGGEPLMCGNKRRGFQLVGLVPSRTSTNCNNGFAVFTRLSVYYNWIMEQSNMLQES